MGPQKYIIKLFKNHPTIDHTNGDLIIGFFFWRKGRNQCNNDFSEVQKHLQKGPTTSMNTPTL